MGILGDKGERDARAPARAPAVLTRAARDTFTPVEGAFASPVGDGRSDLSRRRDRLAADVTELHWDLGGLAYEMAIRDHFRLDVLVRRAAVLQERDAELAEVERLLRMEADGTAGSCPQCGAPHSRGAVFCWQCGTELMQRMASSAVEDGDEATAAMDALLAPQAASELPTRTGE